MSKPNKDGWIRHRGGKCPVDAGALVDVKHRSGDIFYAESALEGFAETWSHSRHRADIMAYRIYKPVEQPVSEPVERKCEGRACEMPDAESHSKECLLDAAIDQGWAGPLQWRDRITEIDRTVEALEEERVALVQRLEDEGFRLIERAVQPVEDMSDWRNWKAGDQVKVILANDCTGLWIDRVVTVRSVESAHYGGSMPVSVFYDGDWNFPEAHDGSRRCVFEFHSRPSK